MSMLCCLGHVVTTAVLPGSLVLSRRDVGHDVATSTAACEFHPLSHRDVSR